MRYDIATVKRRRILSPSNAYFSNAAAAAGALTFRSGPAAGSGFTEVTFEDVAIGDADASRVVVFGCEARLGADVALTATIGGVSATKLEANPAAIDPVDRCCLFYAVVPTGTTADVVLSCAGTNINGAQIAVYTITGCNTTPSDTDVVNYTSIAPGTMSITSNVPSGGFGVACFATQNNVSPTWPGAETEDFSQWNAGQGKKVWGLSTSATGAQSITSSSVTAVYMAAMATWGP
jgi:hypothetical protein